MHVCWQEAPCAAHAALQVDVVGTHDDQKGPSTHDPDVHCIGVLHDAQASPFVPHASVAVPGMQVFPWQHPLAHDDASHVHVPPTQCWPLPQLPLLHTPPQPSLAPHALPVQLGVHSHAPATHCCPLGQLPCVQVPAQPSLAPHAFPPQSGVHGPVPHTLGVPPPPHV